jgi:septum formation protein
MAQIVLASASRRRQELLAQLGVGCQVVASQLDEKKIIGHLTSPVDIVLRLSLAKAKAVRKLLKDQSRWPSGSYPAPPIILAADTIVAVAENQIFGKPITRREAEKMLLRLQGTTHQVLTGLALIDSQGKIKQEVGITKVWIKSFKAVDIQTYLNLGLYTDRAGAYGIQDQDFHFVDRYEGSLTNILGFPLEKVKPMLVSAGVLDYKIRINT